MFDLDRAKKNGLDLDATIMLKELGVDPSEVKQEQVSSFACELEEGGIRVLPADK